MSTMQSTAVEKGLGKRSRQNAFLSFIGLSIFVGSLVYSYHNLRQTEQQLKATQNQIVLLSADIHTLTTDKKKLQSSIGELQKQSASLDNEIQKKRDEYDALKRNVENFSFSTSSSDIHSNVQLGVAGTALYEIQASAKLTGGHTSYGPEYEFSAELRAKSEVLSKIDKVDYFFDHPTFRQPHMESNNPANNFRVSYVGWGCLSRVEVTIFFKDGGKRSSTFDMCSQLPESPRK
jgi:uncharacterized protein YoxC